MLTAGGVQRAQRVGSVAIAVLGGPQPPHGCALLVAGVLQQEPQGAGGPRLAVPGGGEVPARSLLQLAPALQDAAEVQRGPAVPAGGRLPVPLLRLVLALGRPGHRARGGAVGHHGHGRAGRLGGTAGDDLEVVQGLLRALDVLEGLDGQLAGPWPWNVLGWPGVNVPAGFTSDGLPVGAQLLGPEGTEELLISLAAQLEADRRWYEHRPDPLRTWSAPVEQ
nr:amidase family protein [Streptomyces tirandamycinicus]